MQTVPTTSELEYIADTARATWQLAYATWALVLVTLAIAGGTLWVMWRQLRESKATTQLNLHLQLVNDFETERMCAARSRVAATILRGHKPIPNDIESILDRLESVAYYTLVGMIDLEFVWNDFSYAARCYWHTLNHYVHEQRRLRKDNTLFSDIEKLYMRLNIEEAKRRGRKEPTADPTKEEIEAFLQSEAKIGDLVPTVRSPNIR